MLGLVCYLKMWYKKLKLNSHLVTKQSFRHFLNRTLYQKPILQKLLGVVCFLKIWHKKWKFSCHWVTQQLFCQFLTKLKIKKFFSKVFQYGMPFEAVTWKVKVMLPFSHKAVIVLLSKLNLETSFTKFAHFGMLFESMA